MKTLVEITFRKEDDPYEVIAKKTLEPGFDETELAASIVRLIKERVK
ncbi:MAG: hypothetical protein MJZ49_08540 [Bacteroidales bacterium]|nr:hypothetical protein [Bacteroidales bacterium]